MGKRADKVSDPRFKKIQTDPRFRSLPKQEQKIDADDRFQSMFTDHAF